MSLPPQLSPAELVMQHQAGLWRYLRFLGAAETQADDLVQETFLAVFRQQVPFEQRSTGETSRYLRTVARHQFLMLVRRERRGPAVYELAEADEVWDRLAGESAGDDYLAALDDCLGGLNGRGKQAIELRYRHGYSREAIGAQLGLSPDGVKTLLRRTRDVLRDCVERKVTQE